MALSRRRKSLLVIGSLLLLVGVRAWFVFGPPGATVTFEVSKETTYLTEPLLADGRPDYLKAINDDAKAGVTPENNGAVLLFQAFGPQDLPREIRSRFFAALGVEVLPDDGEYFVKLEMAKVKLLDRDGNELNDKARDEAEDQMRYVPWSAEELPAVQKWLAGNERPLALLMQASRKTHYYVPLLKIHDDDFLMGVIISDVRLVRAAVDAFTTRAMLHVQAGNNSQAWDDILAARRLSRLIGRGTSLIHALHEITCDSIAAATTMNLLHFGHCDAELIARMKADIAALGPQSGAWVRCRRFERMMQLDAAIHVTDVGLEQATGLIGRPPPGFWPECKRRGINAGIDWNETLRTVNEWMDRLVERAELPDESERRKALQSLADELKSLKDRPPHGGPILAAIIPVPSWRNENGRWMGTLLEKLFMPAMAIQQSEDRADAVAKMTDVGMALALFRSDRGEYPDRLDQLTPKFLSSLPVDPFGDGPFHYRRTDDGFLLYSVGVNGQDDGGSGFGGESESGDDILSRAGKPR